MLTDNCAIKEAYWCNNIPLIKREFLTVYQYLGINCSSETSSFDYGRCYKYLLSTFIATLIL